MALNLKRKAAIEDLFDRYCQRGDVDTITVSTIPITSTGIQLLISCPSMHGIQRTHEAMHNSITLGLNPKNTTENNNDKNNNNDNNNNGQDSSSKDGGALGSGADGNNNNNKDKQDENNNKEG